VSFNGGKKRTDNRPVSCIRAACGTRLGAPNSGKQEIMLQASIKGQRSDFTRRIGTAK